MGYSYDGVVGVPLYNYACEVLKLGSSVESYALRFFSQGHASTGHLEVPAGVTQQQYDQVVNSWTAAHTGEPNQWKTPALAYGIKYVGHSIPNDDAQLLELRNHQVVEVARLMRVPPHAIFHYMSGGTYANLEAQQTDLVTNCLQPWLTQIEQECNTKLFTGTNLQAEFLVDVRLRGDTQSRYTAHQIGRQGGWLSINDIRRMENMPPIDGGDTYLATPVGGAPNPTPATPAAATAEPAAPADPGEGASNE